MNRAFSRISSVFLVVVTSCSPAGDRDAVVEPGAEVRKLAGGMGFTEGPVWLPLQRKLVFSDIPNAKLMQWSEKDGLAVFRESENSNGNVLDLEGRIVSCQHGARNVIRIGPDGDATVLADRFEGKRFNSPNDVAVRSDGTLWFTDPPWGLKEPHEIPGHWVFKLDPSTGEVGPVLRSLAAPNGIVFSPDESRIYIADTGGHKRHPDPDYRNVPAGIHCYEVAGDGTLGERLFVIDARSDGMAVDVEGRLYTTDRERIRIFDADGNELQSIDVPESPANVCFGGDDYKTLFITARTSLYAVRMMYAGAKPKNATW